MTTFCASPFPPRSSGAAPSTPTPDLQRYPPTHLAIKYNRNDIEDGCISTLTAALFDICEVGPMQEVNVYVNFIGFIVPVEWKNTPNARSFRDYLQSPRGALLITRNVDGIAMSIEFKPWCLPSRNGEAFPWIDFHNAPYYPSSLSVCDASSVVVVDASSVVVDASSVVVDASSVVVDASSVVVDASGGSPFPAGTMCCLELRRVPTDASLFDSSYGWYTGFQQLTPTVLARFVRDRLGLKPLGVLEVQYALEHVNPGERSIQWFVECFLPAPPASDLPSETMDLVFHGNEAVFTLSTSEQWRFRLGNPENKNLLENSRRSVLTYVEYDGRFALAEAPEAGENDARPNIFGGRPLFGITVDSENANTPPKMYRNASVDVVFHYNLV
jgi:hypothetical protein